MSLITRTRQIKHTSNLIVNDERRSPVFDSSNYMIGQTEWLPVANTRSVTLNGVLIRDESITDESQPSRDSVNEVHHTVDERPNWIEVGERASASSLAAAAYLVASGYRSNISTNRNRATTVARLKAAYTVNNTRAAGAIVALNSGWGVSPLVSLASLPSRKGDLAEQVRKRLDGWNGYISAMEMRDMPKLADLFRGRNALWKLLTRPPWGKSLRSWKAFLRIGTNAELARRFGINPTVGDVSALLGELEGLRSHKTSFSVALRGSDKQLINTTAYPGNGCLHTRNEMVSAVRVDGVRVSAKRGAPQLGNPLFETWRRYVGLNPYRYAWDLVPFSFMVDYFLTIGKTIDQVWLLNQPYVDTQWWESVKTEASIRVARDEVAGYDPTWYPATGTPPPGRELVTCEATSKSTSYSRKPAPAPTWRDQMRLDTPGLNQVFSMFLVGLGLGLSRGK